MSENARPGKHTCKKRRRTSTRCLSTGRRHALSVGSCLAAGIGKETGARAYDVLIAATALAHKLPVYTCNPGDFDKIDSLQVVPVRLPEHASG